MRVDWEKKGLYCFKLKKVRLKGKRQIKDVFVWVIFGNKISK